MVALHNSIHMGLNATAKESAVILTGFHHYRKISQLCRTVINIQTVMWCVQRYNESGIC